MRSVQFMSGSASRASKSGHTSSSRLSFVCVLAAELEETSPRTGFPPCLAVALHDVTAYDQSFLRADHSPYDQSFLPLT